MADVEEAPPGPSAEFRGDLDNGSVSAPNSPVWTRKFVPSIGCHRADTLHTGHEQLPGLTSEPDSMDDEPPPGERRKSKARRMSDLRGHTDPMYFGHEQLPGLADHSQSLDSVEVAGGDTDRHREQQSPEIAHDGHYSTQNTSGELASATHRDDNVAPVVACFVASEGAEAEQCAGMTLDETVAAEHVTGEGADHAAADSTGAEEPPTAHPEAGCAEEVHDGPDVPEEEGQPPVARPESQLNVHRVILGHVVRRGTYPWQAPKHAFVYDRQDLALLEMNTRHDVKHVIPLAKIKLISKQPSYPGIAIVSPQGEFLVYMDVGDKALEAWYQRLRADRVRAVKLAERKVNEDNPYAHIRGLVYRREGPPQAPPALIEASTLNPMTWLPTLVGPAHRGVTGIAKRIGNMRILPRGAAATAEAEEVAAIVEPDGGVVGTHVPEEVGDKGLDEAQEETDTANRSRAAELPNLPDREAPSGFLPSSVPLPSLPAAAVIGSPGISIRIPYDRQSDAACSPRKLRGQQAGEPLSAPSVGELPAQPPVMRDMSAECNSQTVLRRDVSLTPLSPAARTRSTSGSVAEHEEQQATSPASDLSRLPAAPPALHAPKTSDTDLRRNSKPANTKAV